MVFHVAFWVASVADAVSQAPFVVQCAQAVPDPWWRWLFQFTLSVFPVAGGVWIAIWSFRSTAKKDRERWVLDQRKLEWSSILVALSEGDSILPHVFKGKEWVTMGEILLGGLRGVLPSMRSAVFIADFLEQHKIIDGYLDFVSDAAKKIAEIGAFTDYINNSPAGDTLQKVESLNIEKMNLMKKREEVYKSLYEGFHEQAKKVRLLARSDLLSEPID